jgi:hypothetical protein
LNGPGYILQGAKEFDEEVEVSRVVDCGFKISSLSLLFSGVAVVKLFVICHSPLGDIS